MFHHCRVWILAGTLLLVGLIGCGEQSRFESANQPSSRAPVGLSNRQNDTIRVASFNIQVLGESKMKKTDVVPILVDVLRRYDVVAIQELRSKNQEIIADLVDLINANGAHYQYVVGPRLGRTISKEQYVFLYDARRIELEADTVYTVGDPQDLLHREPLVASFRVKGLPAQEAFRFTLINIHTDPDDTDIELNALDDVMVSVQSRGEDDVIMLGDLNVNERKLGQLGKLPGITWTVRGEPTNTRGSKSYDNIVFHREATREYTGRSGILNLQAEYGLTEKQALRVSDHLPIWVEFSSNEGGSASVARRPR